MTCREQDNHTNRVRIPGRFGSSLAYTIRDFLHRSDIPFEWVELDSDDDARAKAGVSDLHDPRPPVCILLDGSRLERPPA
jgi:thioredoxin reductase (NADPH)